MDAKAADRILALRHALHACAEVSGQETRTKAMLMQFLREHTSLEVVDCGQWFYALHSGRGARRICLRADMDALPMEESIALPYASQTAAAHKCGHDGHCAVMAGVALSIEQTENTVCFVFQHSEEDGHGAQQCAEIIDRLELEEAYAFHNIPAFPQNTLLLRSGTFACASRGVTVHLHGMASHAAYPEAGRNPAAAVGELLTFLADAAHPNRYRGLVQCTVVEIAAGQRAFGTSAGDASVSFTLRAQYEAELDDLHSIISARACGICDEHHLTYREELCDPFPATTNDDLTVQQLRALARHLGKPFLDLPEPLRWSEDFGYFLKKARGAMVGIGSGTEHPQLHTAPYDFPDAILTPTVDFFTALIQ